ncbi:CHRD domain-containing protein [Lacihabitans sp. CCS-44]|uniref:LamG-like jellyroll fold domain-containing protein n=1 Tax=Lacihabitans sp. CCS-44 TaxID=2487331 RepID=UPI0020CBD0FD|nr:LamG-like jellyroll fold domain-containing protein [Lacihabitans sp. CCS-44]MCP9754468.1 CHRD domain-containing protein [Lacihabitans sp. CCS-44]
MKKLFLFLTLFLTHHKSFSKVYFVSSIINGSNVVPSSNSLASAQILGTLIDDTRQMNFTVAYNGISSAITSITINTGIDISTGPVLFNLATGASPISNSITLTNEQVKLLLDNKLYIQFNTASNTGGEIRGQIGGVELYPQAWKSEFANLKKHAFNDSQFTGGLQAKPFVRKGPSPSNPFVYVAEAQSGIYNDGNSMSTFNNSDNITLYLKSNNVRMIAADCFITDVNAQVQAGNVAVSAFTNLGRFVQWQTTDTSQFIGLRTQSEHEFFVQLNIAKTSISSHFVTVDNLILAQDYDHNIALDFDNDFAFVSPFFGNFNYNDPFTVEFWIKAATQSHSQPYSDIVDRYIADQPFSFLVQIGNTANPGRIVLSRKDISNNNPTLISSNSIDDQNWHHVAMVRNANDSLLLYIDGYLDGKILDNTNDFTQNSSGLFLGGGAQNSNFFKGTLDEFRLWTKAKTLTEIRNEMYCKNPQTTDLQAFFDFDQGETSGNNLNVTQLKNRANIYGNATMSNFAKTGSISNFVNGQIRYVDANMASEVQDGRTWTTAYPLLQTILHEYSSPCNDLAEVWVADGVYMPGFSNEDRYNSFEIPSGMKLYGGFVGNELSILDRDMSKIHTDNLSRLSGDTYFNDSPLDFSTDKADNSYTVVKIENAQDVLLDGFGISGGFSDELETGSFSPGGLSVNSSNPTLRNLKIVENFGGIGGLSLNNSDAKIENTVFAGNKSNFMASAVWIRTDQGNFVPKFYNCLFSGNMATVSINPTTIYNRAEDFNGAPSNPEFYNCSIVNNAGLGYNEEGYHTSPLFKNTVVHGNSSSGIRHASTFGLPITGYSLVEEFPASGVGNLDGTTVNPQFINPIPHASAPTLAGDYRLKWCSKLIDAGGPYNIHRQDLDLRSRYFVKSDIGAYEYLGNAPFNSPTIDFGNGALDFPYGVGTTSSHIISANKVWAPAGTVIFEAPNSITLNPGFEAKGLGNYFEAKVLPNMGCVN